LGMAGDITDFGNRKKVSITRNENDVNNIVTLDLTDPGIGTSEYSYIRSKDVIYVKPLRKKFWAMSSFPYGIVIAAISTGILVYTAVKP
ncbi:MAG: polysaccharide export protein, partial [Cyclobacteriaceae bacterium]|nr:polysaccharide export protein [Cyclobacteriaceae bacterium]